MKPLTARLVRTALLMAILAALVVSAPGRASAQNNDRGTAGTNQGRNCVGMGGHATVYIEEQGDGTSVSYVWCEFPDGSGWSCSNTDYGTGCFSWRSAPTDPSGP